MAVSMPPGIADKSRICSLLEVRPQHRHLQSQLIHASLQETRARIGVVRDHRELGISAHLCGKATIGEERCLGPLPPYGGLRRRAARNAVGQCNTTASVCIPFWRWLIGVPTVRWSAASLGGQSRRVELRVFAEP